MQFGYPFPYAARKDIVRIIPSPDPRTEHDSDCLLLSCLIANPTDAPIQVWVQDCQYQPIYLIPPDTISPGGWVSFADYRGHLMIGGFRWWASATGAHGRALLATV